MPNTNARTSIVMDNNLLFRLRQHSKNINKNVSQIIEEAVTEKLEKEATGKREKAFKSLWKLRESMRNAKADPRYEGMSLDEVLYGEKGAWSTNNMEEND